MLRPIWPNLKQVSVLRAWAWEVGLGVSGLAVFESRSCENLSLERERGTTETPVAGKARF